jgi:thioredoxin reductase
MTLDVAIIGGSFAGLTAALQLGRASRRVAVFDTGRPRNAASTAAHGVPGWDGQAPSEILAAIRRDLSAYPTVDIRTEAVTGLSGAADAFGVTSRPGLFAAGDIIRPAGSVTHALADGATAGIATHQSLIWPDRFPPFTET